ncbi:MAG TPA: FkbM family methyltransferase [Candidatus Sulfotelmatobacter sp.]|nr:FkbM family methyltransferase [Candidatus Sulfotelmatobacter sp.]
MKQIVQKILGKFGYTLRRISTLQGGSPGSHTRPIGEFALFLEDLRARGFVPRGIIDIGANRGEWTKMALSVFPKTPVLMIEPQDQMEPILSQMLKEHPYCKYVKAGAGREQGELVLTLGDGAGEGSSFLPVASDELQKAGKQRKTPIITVENLLAQKFPDFEPDLVKLDIQGFELEALSGAEALFGKTEVFILEAGLIRFMPNQPIVREVISFMAARDYELYDIPGSCRRPYDGALGSADLAFVKAHGMFRKTLDW